MSRIFSTLSVVFSLVALCSFASCQKEKVVNSEKEQEAASDRTVNCPLIKSNIVKTNGMLVFTDQRHFEDCIECLEQEVEDYNDTYEGQYPEATAGQLDSLDIVNGFNEWQPLVQFESQKSFVSLRSIVEAQSEQWLLAQNSETINFDNDPDELCPVMDEEERCLFNTDGLVKIGNNIVSIQNYGEQSMAIGDCCAWARKRKYTFDVNDDPYLVNRQLRAKIKVSSGVIVSKLKGKIKNYKKVSGSYKKRRADMRPLIGGIGFMQETCNPGLQVWSKFKNFKKRKTRKITARLWEVWREAIVCPSNTWYPTHRCSLSFFVDNETHGYLLPLQK
jgi:nitrite reductase/ring-hydroxylating ferredoxin subunit